MDPRTFAIQAAYFISSVLFLLGLRDLTHPDTARRGTNLAAIGMLIAVVGTLAHQDIVSPWHIAGGLILGTLIGIPMGLKIPMTMMPERIALSHSFGGLAVALVGVAEYVRHNGQLDAMHMTATGFEVFFGAVTFTGSLMAFGKLNEMLPGKPITFPGQNFLTLLLMAGCVGMTLFLIVSPGNDLIFYSLLTFSFLLGILIVLPIGGADMPVVICLLNSYAGLAACASGFALSNPVLIVTGSLDGGSGFILAMAMSKAMNRSFTNVIFGAFGSTSSGGAAVDATSAASVNQATVEEAVDVLKYADSVIVVPGYGMAVAQAQHTIRELASILEKRGTRVRFAIHPVAGRMPGHMNVLLAEANVPYDSLYDLDQINDDFSSTDAVLVVGANDVVNPAAKTSQGSPIYGMPVFNCEEAKAVIVLKRSMGKGFAGIENELFIHPKTMMVFGDAKKTIQEMVGAVREGSGGH